MEVSTDYLPQGEEVKLMVGVDVTGLGERVKKARLASNRTVAELAALAGMTRQGWYKIEKEQTQFLAEDILKRVQSALGVDFGIGVE